MSRIAFLNDTSSWYHWGCTGTSEAVKSALSQRGHEVTSVPIQAIYACRMIPEKTQDFDDPQFFNQFFNENLPVTAPILESDIVVINGEGSLHGLPLIARVLLYLAYASKLYCKKQVHMINHSCYPDVRPGSENTPVAQVYRGVYRHLDYVAIREHLSQNVLRTLGIETTLSFDCLPLYIRDHPPLRPQKQSRSIVIAGSVSWHAEGLPALAAYMEAMAADGFEITVLTGAKADPAQDDQAFLTALREKTPDHWQHLDAPSMEVWLQTIQSASMLVSGRFHYTIAACTLGTPCIVLASNTPKNRALCEEARMPPPLSFDHAMLSRDLLERTTSGLGKPPITDEVREEWKARAEKNFERL